LLSAKAGSIARASLLLLFGARVALSESKGKLEKQ
jgi:hypothetical protein